MEDASIMHSRETPKLWPLRQTAHRIGVPAAWLRNEAERGALPSLQVGAHRYFDVELVERLLTERAQVMPDAGHCSPRDSCEGLDEERLLAERAAQASRQEDGR